MCAARRGGSLVAVCLGGKKRTLTLHSGVCGLRGLRQFYEKLLVHPSDTVNNINNAVNNTVNNINTLTAPPAAPAGAAERLAHSAPQLSGYWNCTWNCISG